MKPRLSAIVFVTIFHSLFFSALAQKKYYVVVSAFSTEGNVKDFTMHLPDFDTDTVYSVNDQDNVMQLYVWRTRAQELAKSRALQFQNKLEENTIAGNYESLLVSKNMEGNKILVKKNVAANVNESLNTNSLSSRPAIEKMTVQNLEAPLSKGTWFKFSITDQNGAPLAGKVHNVNYLTQKEVAAYDANAYVDFSRYKKSGELSLTCGIFGYKFSEKNIDCSEPALIDGAYRDQNGAWVIPYKLERLQKGDVSIMYNVAFHKDAVIMLQQSKDDLDELVRLMSENPDYNIVLHGHCNGRNHRKIIAMGAEQQFFDVNGSQEIYGSAKKLSVLRSRAVKNYLIENGIAEKRIKTFGWGGSYMLASENGPFSKLNDRIEVEIKR